MWQGTVRGFMLGAAMVVCLVCLFRCSSQSCRSCLLKQITWSLSNMLPTWKNTRTVNKKTEQKDQKTLFRPKPWKQEPTCPYQRARKHFYGFHSLLMGSLSFRSKAVCPEKQRRHIFSLCWSQKGHFNVHLEKQGLSGSEGVTKQDSEIYLAVL